MDSIERVVSQDEMVRQSRQAKADGQVVVFTNGCFDILHLGHVLYLRDARRLGSVLFVGVNSDASVKRLKGNGRPYNSESDRAEVLAALEDVDLVTVFQEETASDLVEQVKPSVYVKGGDYSGIPDSPAYPVEGEVVARYGGAVHILPFAPGYSTTGLIERIRATP